MNIEEELDILGVYRYGSNDSLDYDVFISLNRIPDPSEHYDLEEIASELLHGLKSAFKSTDLKASDVDISFIHIDPELGVIDWCQYDNLAEANNCLFKTFSHHRYNALSHGIENPISGELTQNISLKLVKTIRAYLTFLSRTEYRADVKSLLKQGSFKERIEFIVEFISRGGLQSIESFNKNLEDVEIVKDIAFSFIQLYSLINGFEVFTKKDACLKYPDLAKYILRKDWENKSALDEFVLETFESLSARIEIFDAMDAVRYVDDEHGCLNKDEQLIEIEEE